ncbi:HlyD family secretion protein [Cupriavidus sp. L7L]|uniref:HlyD family secretion protein n=1 Tax=Cupriavidus sp. L7L TaxID=2546443 RepID=UPI00105546CD|nr:efflux RND transporter periplasmic adaptor subunit [Cupriavidus sp. L7L]TDF62547.1 HlyD family efflux transporter periplasmic adaptor subunit [Cupriavidus sp. L7L]
MKQKILRYGIAVTGVVALAIGVAVYLGQRTRQTEGLLDGNGQVRGTEVTVSAKIAGVADVVAIREGQILKTGDLVISIAARDLEARLDQARAQAAGADALIAELDAQIKTFDVMSEQAKASATVTASASTHEVHRLSEALSRAKAEVVAAEVQVNQDRKTYERFEKLLAQGFISKNYFDELVARYRASEARLTAARQARDEAQAALEKGRAVSGEVAIKRLDVRRIAAERDRVSAARLTASLQAGAARARVAEMEALLADTRILAPVDATVMAKLVEPGELVAAGRPLATLVNLSDLYVRVYVPERDVGRIRLGNPARIFVDAFRDRAFPGKVIEVAQQAEFTPKDVHMKDEREKLVFGVKIAIENPDGLLKPGMFADVKIKVDQNAAW